MAKGEDDKASEAGGLSFTRAEIELLLKACSKYRSVIPIYLKSSEAELRLIDAIIRKLS